jgi:ABC-type uncharacterized transport system substrate-binding protein
LNFLPQSKSSFMPYAIEKPELPTGLEKEKPWKSNKPLHVVHLSTNRTLKGTGLIENALKEAERKLGITYEVIVRKPRPQALAAMARADLLVDQMVLGWYGATAVEAMYNEIPIVGYISPSQIAAAPAGLTNQLPIINTGSNQLFDTIKEIAANREILREVASAGVLFANNWHDPHVAAKQALAKYADILRYKN